MNEAAERRYRARMDKVLEYIDAHLDEPLDLDRLSAAAAFSKYHFHRQFRALYGESVFRYVVLRRLHRAAHELAFRPQRSILDIAIGCGYEGPEAFARAFKKHVGQTPSQFREQPRWDSWWSTYDIVSDIRSKHMRFRFEPEDVKIVYVPETKVAAFEHRGDPRRIGDSIRAFVEWRKQHKLHPSRYATYNIFYTDEDIEPAAFRMDLCVAVDSEVEPNAEGIVNKVIPAGRCAVLRHVGSDETLDGAIRSLYVDWLPNSGEDPRDFPLYLQRITFFPDVPEHEAVSDIFLPLR